MERLVVLSGAGMSAESGIKTFRDMGGIWEQYDVTEVASPEAWKKNPELVLRFYNERRNQLMNCKPNAGHFGLARLEQNYDVQIITQNVDNFHEQAGSTNILHLHGELMKARSTTDPSLIYTLKHWELKSGDVCEKGSQLRPHIVWFGENVPNMSRAIEIIFQANIFAIIGTSLNVYPAAGLINYIKPGIPVYLIDPANIKVNTVHNITYIHQPASTGVEILTKLISKTNE